MVDGTSGRLGSTVGRCDRTVWVKITAILEEYVN